MSKTIINATSHLFAILFAAQKAQGIIRSASPKSQYSQYSSMLPPPPLPPMARPVAIIRSTGDLSLINSPTNSVTPPSVNNMPSPQHTDHGQGTDSNQQGDGSPPMSPQTSHSDSKPSSVQSLTRLTGGREYAFNSYHNTSGQVNIARITPYAQRESITMK